MSSRCSIRMHRMKQRCHPQSTNLIGFTSSLKAFRTKAYTARILLLDGNVFSSCVRSLNLMRIVAWKMSYKVVADLGRKHTAGYLASLAFCSTSRIACVFNGAFTNACVRAVNESCAAFKSAVVGVKNDSGNSPAIKRSSELVNGFQPLPTYAKLSRCGLTAAVYRHGNRHRFQFALLIFLPLRALVLPCWLQRQT